MGAGPLINIQSIDRVMVRIFGGLVTVLSFTMAVMAEILTPQAVQDVAQHLIGVMDTSRQAQTHPNPQPMGQEDFGQQFCTVALRPSALGFVGSTPNQGCPVTMRGASRLTNVVVLHGDGMDTWDRGFDDSGKQLWGAKREPYRYRRLGSIAGGY